jgi:hypothetical protein
MRVIVPPSPSWLFANAFGAARRFIVFADSTALKPQP